MRYNAQTTHPTIAAVMGLGSSLLVEAGPVPVVSVTHRLEEWHCGLIGFLKISSQHCQAEFAFIQTMRVFFCSVAYARGAQGEVAGAIKPYSSLWCDGTS